ncbi:hypothetical protein KAT08_03945 [Candidatus Babeliales bacterium]|nr:hypothetical protein [Candidatus Babeliales bacterium]
MKKILFLLLLFSSFGLVQQTIGMQNKQNEIVTIPSKLAEKSDVLNNYFPTPNGHLKSTPVETFNVDDLNELYSKKFPKNTLLTTKTWQDIINLAVELTKQFEGLKKDKISYREIIKKIADEISNKINNPFTLSKLSKISFAITDKIFRTSFLKNIQKIQLQMFTLISNYFSVEYLLDALYVKFAKDLKNNKDLELFNKLNKNFKLEILKEFYILFKEQYNSKEDVCRYITPYCLMKKGLLPILETLPLSVDLDSKNSKEESANNIENHYNHIQYLAKRKFRSQNNPNFKETFKVYAQRYAKHPQLHEFFDNIPYCSFKNHLVKEIYNYAKLILDQQDKQQIFNNLPEGILKLIIRLISQPGQLQLDTNVIDLTTIKQRIENAKNTNVLYLSNINNIVMINDQNLITYQKLINHIITLLPIFCSNLEKLNLSWNKLTSLSSEIGNLNNLTWLLISDNNLEFLPTEIGNLNNLTWLQISDNNLEFLPTEIGKLNNLQSLDISNNNLKSLPPEIGNLNNLILLQIEDNKLTSLPIEIGNLSNNLTRLDLSNNKLTSLPTEIGNLNNLILLQIKDNKLTSLPIEIGNLTNLQKLDISNNKLTSLPTEIGNLSNNLTWLQIGNNKLTINDVPENLRLITGL